MVVARKVWEISICVGCRLVSKGMRKMEQWPIKRGPCVWDLIAEYSSRNRTIFVLRAKGRKIQQRVIMRDFVQVCPTLVEPSLFYFPLFFPIKKNFFFIDLVFFRVVLGSQQNWIQAFLLHSLSLYVHSLLPISTVLTSVVHLLPPLNLYLHIIIMQTL